MTGTTIAQAIPIAISPILTRMYTPEDFGIFALYISVASIISSMATGRYESAILLPKEEDDAVNIVILSILVSTFISFISLLIVFIFNYKITSLLGNPKISIFLYLIPLSVFLTGLYQSINYWINRQKRYKQLATNRIIQSGTTSSTSLLLGYGSVGSIGLISGNILGLLISSYILGKNIYKEDSNFLKKINKIKLLEVAKRYIDFPKYDMPAILANTIAQQTPHILFNLFFNATVSGYYYLTQRILQVPIIFIGRAFLDVFKEIASKDFLKYGNAREIYLITFNKLVLIGFVPSVFLYYFSIELFVFVFGDNWTIAGEYAQILAPMLFLRFVSSPLSFMFYIGEKQKLNLLMQTVLLIMILSSFFIFNNPKNIILSISILSSIFYIFQIVISAKIAKVFKGKK
jgi:O-antigen/teichoic acid export membrane protein